MLVRPDRSFPGTMFMVRGTALGGILPYWIPLVVWSVAVAELYALIEVPAHWSLTTLPFTLIGLALSIFLGFRNNAAYDRWWEGRKLWGALINQSRSTARQTLTLVNAGGDESFELRAFQQEMIRRQIAYVYALKAHLRTTAQLDEVAELLDKDEVDALDGIINVPNAIALETGRKYREAWKRGWVETFHLPVFEESLTNLLNIQGGCERIKKTPVPLGYTLLTHRIVGTYCIALPFGITDQLGWLAPAVVALVSFAFLGLDLVGTQLEDPFEEDPNDLPLHAMCRTIDRDLRQMMDDPNLPPEPKAVRHVLL